MVTALPDAREIVRRGQEIYEQRLRSLLEPGNEGRLLVIDVDTGDYALGEDMLEIADRLHAERPAAPLYTMRIGFPFTDRLGGRAETPSR
jgi:hypothetical protein